jgi:FkbM family methyltransferase
MSENTPCNGHSDLTPLYDVKNFTVIESIWGKFILCRNAEYHAEYMIKNGRTIHPAELETLATIISVLPKNCVIVDAGANVGAFCVPMSIAAKKRNGNVYAFEVQKKLFQALCGTIVLNDFDNLEVFNLGLGSTISTINIPQIDYSKKQDYGIVSLTNQEKIQGGESRLVDIITIDSLDLERLDLLKIDVEGMEIDVLNGGISTIQTHRPFFWIEHWFCDKEELKKYFDYLGNYEIYQVTGADILCVPKEKIQELVISCPKFFR